MKFVFKCSIVVLTSIFCNLTFAGVDLKSCDASEAESGIRIKIIKDLKKNFPEADIDSLKVSFRSLLIPYTIKCVRSSPWGSEIINIRTGTYVLHARFRTKDGNYFSLGRDAEVIDRNGYGTGKYVFSPFTMKTHLLIDSINEKVIGTSCSVSIGRYTVTIPGAYYKADRSERSIKADINLVNVIPFHEMKDIVYDPHQPPQSGVYGPAHNCTIDD